MFDDVGVFVAVEVVGGFAACIGLLFVLIGWVWVIIMRITQRENRSHLSLWLFTIAVLIFPVLWVVYGYFPTNIQDMYFGEWKMSYVYTAGNIVIVLLVDIISMICACWDGSRARIAVMIGATAMLIIYAVGIAMFCLAPDRPSWLR